MCQLDEEKLFFLVLSFNIAFLSAQVIEKIKPNDIEGYWIGTFTVDYGFGKRDSFPYEMSIKRTKSVIEGASASTIEIDGQKYFEFINEGTGFTVWPYDKKQFLILNLAIGGNWGGVQGVDNTIFPTSMQVDYVRVYKMIP